MTLPGTQRAASAARVIATLIRSDPTGLYAVTGPAGAGKTYVAAEVARTLAATVYSADFRFIGDSEARRDLMSRKLARSISDFRDSANQFNWWDWNAIEEDLAQLAAGQKVTIASAYDRSSGTSQSSRVIPPAPVTLFEGALLGPPQLVSRLKKVFFLCTPPRLRFERILAKDLARRSFNEILARFLITEYSETLHYRALFSAAGNRLVFLDGESGEPVRAPELPSELFMPVKVTS